MEPPTFISSHRNPHFKRWLSLLDSKGVKRHHQCIISGEKITKSLLQDPNVLIHSIILSPFHPENIETFSDFPCYTLNRALFQDLDIFGTHSPLLICDVPALPTASLTKAPSGLEVICPVGDPGNLGTILRSCLAFGAQKIILPQEAVHPFHPKVIRASSGAVFSLRLEQTGALSTLNSPQSLRWVTALDLQGKDLEEWEWQPQTRLLIGEEGTGIPSFSYQSRLCISQYDSSIPLNAAVAVSIACHAYHQHFPSHRE